MGKGCHFGVNRRSEVRLHSHCWLVKCSSTNFSVKKNHFPPSHICCVILNKVSMSKCLVILIYLLQRWSGIFKNDSLFLMCLHKVKNTPNDRMILCKCWNVIVDWTSFQEVSAFSFFFFDMRFFYVSAPALISMCESNCHIYQRCEGRQHIPAWCWSSK